MMDLETSQSDYETLHADADTKARTIKISRALLAGLLIDHSAMIAELDRKGVTCE